MWPPHSDSDHQDYYIFSRGSQPKPSFPTVTVRGPYPIYTPIYPIDPNFQTRDIQVPIHRWIFAASFQKVEFLPIANRWKSPMIRVSFRTQKYIHPGRLTAGTYKSPILIGKWSSKPPFFEFHVNLQGCILPRFKDSEGLQDGWNKLKHGDICLFLSWWVIFCMFFFRICCVCSQVG